MGKKDIYLQLRAAGVNHLGACALLGNWEKESNVESVRVENDFTSDRSKSKTYMANVDNGILNFIDARGWGLAQWTYFSRKENLLSFCKALGKSIGDEGTQVAFAVKELREDYPDLWKYLQTTQDLYKATERVCKEFEKPAVNNVEERYGHAKDFNWEFASTVPTQEELDEIAELNQSTTGQVGNISDTNASAETPLKDKLTNETVLHLQVMMLTYGYNPGKVDGLWGPQTKTEAAKFFADLLKV